MQDEEYEAVGKKKRLWLAVASVLLLFIAIVAVGWHYLSRSTPEKVAVQYLTKLYVDGDLEGVTPYLCKESKGRWKEFLRDYNPDPAGLSIASPIVPPMVGATLTPEAPLGMGDKVIVPVKCYVPAFAKLHVDIIKPGFTLNVALVYELGGWKVDREETIRLWQKQNKARPGSILIIP